MGNIKFEGNPPYALPIAQYVTARAEGAVVEMTHFDGDNRGVFAGRGCK